MPTFCDICFWKCGAIAYVQDGQLWKIEGNPDDPLSRGRLCPRGTGGVGAHFDPDRLKAPLIRRKRRGEDDWAQVTWDEALGHVAEKHAGDQGRSYGPEAVALFSHGIGGNFLKHTMKAYGTPNIAAPSFAQCRGPRDVGFHADVRRGGRLARAHRHPERALPRAASARTSARTCTTRRCRSSPRPIGERRERSSSSTRASRSPPSKAKHYLPIKPGTDLALLLAWMHVLVTEGLYDKEYVAQHGFGFDAFAAEHRAVHAGVGVPRDGHRAGGDPRDGARDGAPPAGDARAPGPPRHVVRRRHAAQPGRSRCSTRCSAAGGARAGSTRRCQHGRARAIRIRRIRSPSSGKVDNPGGKYPFALETLTTGIREATLTGQPYPVKGWFVYATNLCRRCPNEAETIKAIQSLDLLVVVDVIPSEIAGWADVVLPESMYLERYDDLNVELFREPFVALRQPVVRAAARPEAELVDRARAGDEARPRARTTRGRPSRSTSTRGSRRPA